MTVCNSPHTIFSMQKKRVLVFTRRAIFHKFETLMDHGLEVVLADVSEYERYSAVLADFDLIFLRIKDEDLLRALMGKMGTPVLDNPAAIEFSLDRWRVLGAAEAAGVPVPEQLLPGESAQWPVVVKNRVDRGDNLPRKLSPGEWAAGRYPYAQRFLESEWEYKVYAFGKRFWFYRQRPTLFFPDKLATREPLGEIRELKEYTAMAAKAAGLQMVSADFLFSGNLFYLTDLNPTPGLQNLPGGYGAVVPELLRIMRK